jgi:hypothetical protein
VIPGEEAVLLLLTLLAACTTVSTTECVTARFPIGNHEVAGDLTLTPADVLDVVVGPFTFTGTYDDGSQVAGDGEVVRGAGEAMVTDATLVTHTSKRVDPPRPWWSAIFDKVGVIECRDTMEIPVDATLRTDDGAVELSFDGIATPPRTDIEPDFFAVEGDVDPEDALALPDAPDPALWPHLALQWDAAGLTSVSLWWEGGDYVQILEAPAE